MAHRYLPPLRVWVWTAATLALIVAAALLWRGSDAAATQSSTAAPAGVPLGAPAGRVSQVWSAASDPMPGDVVEKGRVVVAGAHGVRGLDPLTGDEAWHYTRSNARLCGLAVTNGVVVTVFRTEDRCDEVTALDADTGVRRYTRNVNFRGDATISAADSIVLAASRSGVVTLDPVNDNIRWRYEPPERCRILDAEAGSVGIAVLQRCSGSAAVQLRILDGFSGKARWSRDLPDVTDEDVGLLSADRLVGVRVDDEVQLLGAQEGEHLGTVAVAPDARMTSVGVAELLLTDGTLSAFDPTSGKRLWDVPAVGLPAAPIGGKEMSDGGVLLVPEAAGFVPRNALTGKPAGDPSVVDDVPADGVVSGVGRVVVVQLADRVIAYA
jgi:outer membrane protein assembly factor BamB